jgi:Uma2 family endonuclease
MSVPAQRKMTVDEFLAWAEGREGRWELLNGVPYSMSPERSRHGRVKYAVQTALLKGIRNAGLPCHMLPDSVGIRISPYVMHVPDALVYCGQQAPDDALEVSNPVVVAEVASPSTRKFDETVKLSGYFGVPSVHHCLIVDPEGPPVVHFSRRPDGTPHRRVVHDGTPTLSPPGIEMAVSDLFAA